VTIYYDRYLRLEPSPNDRDLQRGFEAAIHDPAWFLSRQWQMGEHQGENAATPILLTYRMEAQPIQTLADEPAVDLTAVPAEAVVESELDDWWTMGRRIRIGRLFKKRLGAGHEKLRFYRPTPPYDSFHGEYDGLAIWRQRHFLSLTEADFNEESKPPSESPLSWDSGHLYYERSFDAGSRTLKVKQHPGGAMDWYSVDATEAANPLPNQTLLQLDNRTVVPAPLVYPGVPHNRWWQIENAQTDIGGHPPDSSHFPTMLMVDLIYSHSDDWFLFPVTAHAGHTVSIKEVEVQDAFSRKYSSEDPQHVGLRTPDDWSLFQCNGLDSASLVLWHVAELSLESNPIERVQFGIDEQANLLWAVERIVDGREVESRYREEIDEAAHPPFLDPASKPSGDMNKVGDYQYVPGQGISPHWHPYEIAEEGERLFVQRGLVDLSRQHPAPMPRPEAEALLAGTPAERQLHRIQPASIPGNGIEIERRWMLARDRHGHPVQWIQRRRVPLRNPPAHMLSFDVMEKR